VIFGTDESRRRTGEEVEVLYRQHERVDHRVTDDERQHAGGGHRHRVHPRHRPGVSPDSLGFRFVAAHRPVLTLATRGDAHRASCCWIEVAIWSIGSVPVTACWTPAMIAEEAAAKAGPNGGIVTVEAIC